MNAAAFMMNIPDDVFRLIIHELPDSQTFARFTRVSKRMSRLCLDTKMQDVMKAKFITTQQIFTTGRYIMRSIMDGVPHGDELRYDDNGTLIGKCQWKRGNQDGAEETYFEDGSLQHIIHWKMGRRDGLEEAYRESGKIRYQCGWVKDNRDGTEIMVSGNGHVRTIEWDRGQIKYQIYGSP